MNVVTLCLENSEGRKLFDVVSYVTLGSGSRWSMRLEKVPGIVASLRRDGDGIIVEPLGDKLVANISGRAVLGDTRLGRDDTLIISTNRISYATAPAMDDEEATLVAAIQRGDEPMRRVYADWLEEKGRTDAAGYVRLELELRGLRPDSNEVAPALKQLSKLTKRLSAGFRASVSRPVIEGCTQQWELKCPRAWESLTLTADPRTRVCDSCAKQVTFCASVSEAASLAQQGHCVAVEVTEKRHPGDLAPVAHMGRLVAVQPLEPAPAHPAAALWSRLRSLFQ